MRRYLFISLIFLFFTCLFTYPSVFHLSDKIIGDGGDSSLLMGWQYVAKTQVEKGVFPFSWTNYWRYPTGFDFSISYDSTLFILLGLFLYNFSGNPALVYNLSVLILIFLNGVFSYLFFSKLSKNRILGISGALIYGFSFYVLARLGGHMNLIFVGGFPFFLYSLFVFKEKKGNGLAYLLMGLSIILIFLSSLQYFLIFLGAAIFILPLFIFFYSKVFSSYASLIGKNKIKAASTLLVTLFVFLLFNIGHVSAFFKGTLTTLPASYMSFLSPYLINFLMPNSYIPLVISSPPFPRISLGGIEGSLYLGLVEMALFLYFLFTNVDKRLKIFLSLSVLALFVVSLGCSLRSFPYCYIYNFFPFKGIAEVGRFYIALYLFLTVGIVFVLKRISPALKWLVPIIFICIIFERIPSNFYLSDLPDNEPFIKVVRTLNSNAVFDLPIVNQWESTRQKTNYDLYSIYYQKPIVGGSIQWLGNTPDSERFLDMFLDLECGTQAEIDNNTIRKTMLPALNDNNIKTIVFHKILEPFDRGPQTCDQAILNIKTFIYGSGLPLKKVYEDEKAAVFQLQ